MILFNPKLKTLYKRDGHFKVTDELTDNRYSLVDTWLLTEKMDGTSVIISTADHRYEYFGRTAKSQFTPQVHAFMDSKGGLAAGRLWERDIAQADIYAELVGPGIQGNPHGLSELELFVFDVRVGEFWLDWHNAKDVAVKAGLRTVSEWSHPMDVQATTHAMAHPWAWNIQDRMVNGSGATTDYIEGVVARTDPYLYDNQGNRVMWKLKVSDFPE